MVRHFSAGGLVYRYEAGKPLFLLRRNTVTPGFYSKSSWSLPKGWIDDLGDGVPGEKTLGKIKATDEDLRTTAVREVAEETGVDAKIISSLGSDTFFFFDHNKDRIFKIVTYFLMEYEKDRPEGFGSETSEIRWATDVESIKLLGKRKGEVNLIIKAMKTL